MAFISVLTLTLAASAADETPTPTPEAAPTATPVAEASAAATPRPIEELDLDDLLNLPVVTASGGKAEERALTAANVISVSRDEIALRGWRSLAEILESVPGLYVINDHVVPGVAVRGVSGGLRAGTRVVRVMINSVEVNFRPELTAFTGPEFIPVETIERVEIAKGPLSALYGANAFLATVNVITREPKAQTGEVSFRHLSMGEGDGFGSSALVGVGSEGASFMAAYTGEQVDRSGLETEKTFEEQDPDSSFFRPFFADKSANDTSAPMSAFGQGRFTLGPIGKLSAQIGHQRLDANGEFQLNSVLTHRTRVSVENSYGSVQWEREFGDFLRAHVRGGMSAGQPTRDEALYLSGNNDYVFTRNFRYRSHESSGSATISPITNLDVTAGYDWRQDDQTVLFYTQTYNVDEGTNEPGDQVDRIGANDTREFLQTSYGVFVQAAGEVKGVRLSANVRTDEPGEGFDSELSWRAAVAYRLTPGLAAKVIAGRAFQVPSGLLLYGLTGFGVRNNVIGSRTSSGDSFSSLKPQSVTSVEAIVSASVLDLFAVEAAVFQQEVEDRIEFIQFSNNFVAQNRGKVRNIGTEFGVRAPIGRIDPHVNVSALWTERDKDGAKEWSMDAPALYPGLQVLAGIAVKVPEVKLRAVLDVIHVGERGASQSNILLNNDTDYTLPAYTRMDLTLSSLGLHLVGGESETRFLARVRNVSDEKWSEPGFGGFDIPQLGRTMQFEVRQAF